MVAMTHRLISYMRGCKLIKTNEIVPSAHRGYLIDVDINGYFECEVRLYNNAGRVELNPSKRSHREKFEEYLLKHIDEIRLEEKLSMVEKNANEQNIN